jgi:integrase
MAEEPVAGMLARYDRWLSEQRLSAATRRSYRRWVAELLEDLAGADAELGILNGRGAKAVREREAELRDWRRRLVDRRPAPSTVNLALGAAASLLDALRLPSVSVPRVEPVPPARRALELEQLRDVERASDGLASARDRAIMAVLLRTGLRAGEVAALEVGDLRVTQRTGELVVRHGKRDQRRVVPLVASVRRELRAWLAERAALPGVDPDAGPLWIRRGGGALSVRSITTIATGVMRDAGVEESAHALRHTLATRLLRERSADLTLVADILGHADVRTTRRYTRSTIEDRRAAMQDLDA